MSAPTEAPTAALPDVIGELLSEYGGAVHQEVTRYLADGLLGSPLSDLMQNYPARGGKGLRPTLLIAAAMALGGDFHEAVPAATALEILHNAQLVHDDIEDESEERRGQPALHCLHDVPQAIFAGDGLAFRGLRPILDSERLLGSRLTLQLLEECGLMMHEVVAGQALDLGWRIRNAMDLDESDYLKMVLQKTCWPSTIFPMRAGALIGSRGTMDLTPMVRFGFFLGAAFQIQDDLLNLTGQHALYGKEIGGDLWEGKRTLMSMHLLQRLPRQERSRLETFFGQRREQRNSEDVEWVYNQMRVQGSLSYAREFAHGLAGAALTELESIFSQRPPSRDREFIRQLVLWVLGRAA